jgi:hypothetical protein
MVLLSDYLQGKHTSSLTQVDSNMCTFLIISRIKTIKKKLSENFKLKKKMCSVSARRLTKNRSRTPNQSIKIKFI